ncbi:Similar to GIN1: Gypsy retrotransposon integrase-like protein 1 (Rattus norvegicus) [Cotesia congregata]|uniref:Similar to GIN1: Gypsy retrotransposon integrase-like protein 1 (Rattus norvegicus) n=1 Tax=Cotesia congregata TaxID=51543 RepID=A0A8J2H982_COTCN|nr:Similar to GIN1: Gypsy retrotransposon integrase-like protein 1 (Rattus norvegicus) [Cotesia congregata]
MFPRTPVIRPSAPVTSISNVIEQNNLDPLYPILSPPTNDDLLHPENSQSRVMNSTANPAVDPGNVSTAHVSGIQPLAESESANSSTQVLQGVIQQLRAEIQAMRAAQQGLPPTCTSTTSHTNTIPLNSNVPPVDSFGNNLTFYPRELFPVSNMQPTPQPPPPGIPPYFYPPPQALNGAASLPYAPPPVPLPRPTLPPQSTVPPAQTMSAPPPGPPVYFYTPVPHVLQQNTLPYQHTYIAPRHSTAPVPTQSWQSTNTTLRLNDICRTAKSWNITFPPRDASVKLDAKKFLTVMEQRMDSNDIPIDHFRSVITTTLTGHILEWYYQNEHLFINWQTFKEHFKIWQTHHSDEALLQEIFSLQQGDEELGISFINRMQCSFAQLEEPLPENRQVRIIIQKFNFQFLSKFAEEPINTYSLLYKRVSAWQSVIDAGRRNRTELTANNKSKNQSSNNSSKPRTKINAVTDSDPLIRDNPDTVTKNDERTILDAITGPPNPHFSPKKDSANPSTLTTADLQAIVQPQGYIGTRPPTQPWTIISIDTIGPYTKSSSGHQYALVIEDIYTRYLEIFPLRQQTGKEIVKHLRNALCHWGPVRQIISDNALWKARIDRMDELRHFVERYMLKARERTRKQHEKRFSTQLIDLKIGDQVYYLNKRLSKKVDGYSAKLAPKYAGPAVITEIVSPLVVKLADSAGNSLGTHYLNDLKLPRRSKRHPLSQITSENTSIMSLSVTPESLNRESLISGSSTETLYNNKTSSHTHTPHSFPSLSLPPTTTSTKIQTSEIITQLDFSLIPKPAAVKFDASNVIQKPKETNSVNSKVNFRTETSPSPITEPEKLSTLYSRFEEPAAQPPIWVSELLDSINELHTETRENTVEIQSLQKNIQTVEKHLSSLQHQQLANLSSYVREVTHSVDTINHRFDVIEPKMQLIDQEPQPIAEPVAAKFPEQVPEHQPTIYDAGSTPNNKAVTPVLASQLASACGPNARLKIRRETSKPSPKGAKFPPSPFLTHLAARGELPAEQVRAHVATGAIKETTPVKPVMITYATTLPYSQTVSAPKYNVSISPTAAFQQFLKDTEAELTAQTTITSGAVAKIVECPSNFSIRSVDIAINAGLVIRPSAPVTSISNVIEQNNLDPLYPILSPPTNDDLLHPENSQSRVMNSTANPAVDPGNVSTAHVSGIQPLAESESANSSTQVLQGVIQQLRAEIQAMRAAQQGLPPTCTSTTSHTNTIPLNSNVPPVDSFGNNLTFFFFL